MLIDWADKIIFTEQKQMGELILTPDEINKSIVLDVGPDTFPRPFNPELLALAKQLLEDNKAILKNK